MNPLRDAVDDKLDAFRQLVSARLQFLIERWLGMQVRHWCDGCGVPVFYRSLLPNELWLGISVKDYCPECFEEMQGSVPVDILTFGEFP